MGLASTAGLSRIGRWRKGARACIISRCRAAYLFVGARGDLDPPRCPGSNRGRSGNAVQANPDIKDAFQQELQRLLPASPDLATIDRCLRTAWLTCAPSHARQQATQQPQPEPVPCLWRLRAQRTRLGRLAGGNTQHLPTLWTLWCTTAKITRLEREVAQQRRDRRRAFLLDQTATAEQSRPGRPAHHCVSSCSYPCA